MVTVEEQSSSSSGVPVQHAVVMSVDGQQQLAESDKAPEASATTPHPPPAMAVHLPEELMSSVLVFLRMKDMLEWRIVSSSTKAM